MDKGYIRKFIRIQKNGLNDETKQLASKLVFRHIENLLIFNEANNILLYHSLPDELHTIAAIDSWKQKKNIYLPRVNGEDLEIVQYNNSCLASGAFYIKEPTGCNITDISAIDLIIVPAVAFDRNGNRIGRGKGFYDRLLAKCDRQIKIGIGYDFQLIDEIEAERHDIPVDMIITPHYIINTKSN